MKKIFLIPLVALFACISAWAETRTAGTADEFTAALSESKAGDEIRLTDSFAYPGAIGKSVTIDLNGCVITATGTFGIEIGNAATVTFTDNSSEKDGGVAGLAGSYCFDVYSKLIINAGVYNAAQHIMYLNDATTEVEINGGTLTATDLAINAAKGSLTMHGGSLATSGSLGIQVINASVTVENGSIVGQIGIGIYGGTLTVNNGSITGTRNECYGICQAGGTTTINNGTINGDKSGIFILNNTSVLNIHGGTIVGNGMAITGNGSPDNWGTTINIDGGSFGSESTTLAIYHPQDGELNIEGGDFIGRESAIEIRAGELHISGNPTFTSVATEYSCDPNGSGTTTIGAALAIAQHTTKRPITVEISGGTFRGVYPISQSNPQQNAAEYVDLLTLTVSGGKFWATNTANVAAYSQNDKLKFKGGYYNLAPHAFVYKDNEHQYFALSNDDATTLAEGYLFKVAEQTPQEITNVNITEGNWVVEETWEDDGQQNTIPTETSNVTITASGNVTVEPKAGDDEAVAYANELTLEAGASLTIKDGGTLVLGSDANVETGANLVIEDGGQLLIAPTATPVQPKGSATLVADGAGLKPGKADHTVASNLFWQHFAIPTVGAPDDIQLSYPNGTAITDPITYYNSWSITDGWESITKANLTEPFVGYNFSNILASSTNVNYTFTGTLVGNASSPLTFAHRGFSFFGNSYLAPINIQALQSSMYEQGLEFTVYVYTKQGNRQTYRAINEVTASIYGIEEIKPMQGFFMFADAATSADFQYNSAVYSAFINKQNGGANSAPARRASKYNAKAIIGIESVSGEYDEVVLVESNDYTNDYDLKADARKMETSGMNIFADGSFDILAVMATNDLMGQTISFKASDEVHYTMTFSGIEGDLALQDNVTGAVVAMEEGASYDFAAQPNSTVEGRFEIVPVAKVTTAIDNTAIKANVKGIYSMTGLYLGENFNALPAGVYVVDGVKIVK